jgi:hypothetical protein
MMYLSLSIIVSSLWIFILFIRIKTLENKYKKLSDIWYDHFGENI